LYQKQKGKPEKRYIISYQAKNGVVFLLLLMGPDVLCVYKQEVMERTYEACHLNAFMYLEIFIF
jgi:hypothetical protein